MLSIIIILNNNRNDNVPREDEEGPEAEDEEEKININDILEWFPRSVSSDSIVESTYCVDLVRRLPSPLSIKMKGRFCPGKCFTFSTIVSFGFFFLHFPHCGPPAHSSHHGPFDQLIIVIFNPMADRPTNEIPEWSSSGHA